MILSYFEKKGKHSFDFIKNTDKMSGMVITNEVFTQISDDIAAVRGFL